MNYRIDIKSIANITYELEVFKTHGKIPSDTRLTKVEALTFELRIVAKSEATGSEYVWTFDNEDGHCCAYHYSYKEQLNGEVRDELKFTLE